MVEMGLKAKFFVKNRKNALSITQKRVSEVMWYMAECYNLLASKSPVYSKANIKKTTSYHFEDFLKMDFVDSYLAVNKGLFKGRISCLEELTFNYETVKRFTDEDGKQKSDKIDVYVSRLGLKHEWGLDEDFLYLAIECKRFDGTSGQSAYIKDIENFCKRKHLQMRIPFEGQVAFIEKAKLSHSVISTKINKKLQSHKTITTVQPLKNISFNTNFHGGYSSIHQRNFENKAKFTIYHLMFNYSSFVTA
jgi:hypothetical protein